MNSRTLHSTAAPEGATSRRIAINPPSSTLSIYIAHLLRTYKRIGLIWASAFSLYVAMIVLIFPSFQESGALDAVENYPDALKEAFNFQSISTIESFIGAEIYSYAPLVLAFLPIMAFSSAIAGAEERGSLDIMLGTPMPRRNLVISHWVAVATVLLAILAVAGVVSWLSSLAVDAGLEFGHAMRASLSVFPISLAFGSLALLLSTRLRQRGAVIGITFAIMFLMYLLDVVGKLVPEMSEVRWFSAFRYYGNAIVDGVSWGNVAVLLGASLLLLAASIQMFDRRDIYT